MLFLKNRHDKLSREDRQLYSFRRSVHMCVLEIQEFLFAMRVSFMSEIALIRNATRSYDYFIPFPVGLSLYRKFKKELEPSHITYFDENTVPEKLWFHWACSYQWQSE